MAARQPKPAAGQSTTGPTCAICARPKQLDKILVACIRCLRHYHPACHRPIPRNPFTCALCRSRAWRRRLKAAQNHHGIKYDSSSQTAASSSSVTTSTTADTMFSYKSSSDNPFLPHDEDDTITTKKKKCRDPNCQEKALKDLPTCLEHLVSPPPTEKVPGPDSRKTLDAKKTARKSTTRTPFLPAAAKLNQPLSANSRLSNGFSTNKASLSKAPESSLPESPARKRQRLISPRGEDLTLNPGRSASPLAMPNGVLQGMQNGNSIDTSLHRSGKLPTLNADLRSFGPATADLDGRQRPVLSYGDYLKSPLTAGLNFGGDLPKLSTDLLSNTNRLDRADSSPKSLQRNGSIERLSSQKTPPTKATPTRTKSGQPEKVEASPHSKLKAVTRTPPLEKQRRSLVQEKKASSLDDFIYAQSGTSQPPPGESSIKSLELKRQENVLYAPIDPRTHRMRPHSEVWYQQKEAEIRARGGRKANFGKATQRMKEQRAKDSPRDFEAALPDRVLRNENWVNALRWFDDPVPHGESRVNTTPTTPVKTKRPYRRRQLTSTSNLNERLAGEQLVGD